MNVLITRPDHRGEQLLKMCEEQQIFAIYQPLVRIEAGKELPQLPSILSRLKQGDIIFAVSKNAVEYATQTLIQTGFKWRSDLHYFAVGQQTANYLSSQSEQAVRYPLISETSEGLLALPELQHLENKTVVILRGNGGREFFAEQATLRGAEVQTVECYQRLKLDVDLTESLSLCKRAGIDTIMVTSGDTLERLQEYTAESEQEWLKSCHLIVVSQRLARLALQLGWQADHILCVKRADNKSLFEMLMKMKSV